MLVRVDLDAESTITTVPGFRPVVLGRLEDLAPLLSSSGDRSVRTSEQRLVDAACVLALTALALFGFDDTFSSRVYLATGVTGAAVAVLIAICVAGAVGPRTEIYLLAAAALYVPVGAVAAFRPYEEGRLPSGEQLTDVLTSTLTGTQRLLTTIPPLDPVGSVMVLPYALGYLSAATAVWLAFRTRRPLAPLVPLLLTEGVVVLLGPLRPGDRTLVAGVAFAAIAFWWASWRTGDPSARGTSPTRRARKGREGGGDRLGHRSRGHDRHPGRAGVLARRGPDRPAWPDRQRCGHRPVRQPVSAFRRYTEQKDGSPDNVYGKTLFVVKGLNEPTAMRFVTLDQYDGTAWRAGNDTVADAEDDLYQRIGSQVAAPRPGADVEVNVEMRPAYTGAWLPLVGQLTSIAFDFADGDAQREDVRYDPATSSAFVVGGLGPDDDYTFTAAIANNRLAKNSQAYEVDAPLAPAGQRLDEYLAPYVKSGRDPLTQVLLLARYLQRNGRYSDGAGALVVPPGHDVNRLAAQFIGARRIVGNDEQYAAFLALAANRLRVPARVVVGTFTDNGKVQGKDVTAWVELRVHDGSWRILPTPTFMSHRKPSKDDEPPQSLEEFVQDQLPQDDTENPDSEEQVPLPDDDADPDQQDEPSEESSIPGGRLPLGLLLLGLASWVVPLLKLARRGWRQNRLGASARVVGAWRELVDLAVDLRVPVPRGATREAQASALGVPTELAQHADDLIFGVEPPDLTEADHYWVAVGQARQGLVDQHPRWRRIRALFNPASLVVSVRQVIAVASSSPRDPLRRLRRA